MIVDSKGKMFEDRRKASKDVKNDRRKEQQNQTIKAKKKSNKK